MRRWKGIDLRWARRPSLPSLSLEIQRLTMIQTDHPDPPVAEIPRWVLSIQWSQIFSGVLVSDYLVSRPILHITLPQAKQELQEEVPIHEKGWREAVYSFYPLKINEFKIEDADVTYVDQDVIQTAACHTSQPSGREHSEHPVPQ